MASVSGHIALVLDMCGNEVRKYVVNLVTSYGLADVKFSPDQHHLILAGLDNTIRIVDWRTGSLVQTLLGHTDRCYAVDILPISRKIVSAGFDQTVKVWSRQKTVKDISPKTNFGYLLEKTLTGQKVMSGTQAQCSVLTMSERCLSSERGGKRRLGDQRLR